MITRGTGSDIEVFLGERAPELRFFGGYWALPGGTIDDEDYGSAVPGQGDEAAAMQACARRELFEETGLLWQRLPPEHASRHTLRALRQGMLERDRPLEPGNSGKANDGPRWGEVAAALEGAPLSQLCRIETPPFAPVRYDTVFFHVPIEECTSDNGATEPDVWPGELTQGRFFRPDEVLAQWRRGEIFVVPPVVIVLEHLDRAADIEDFRSAMATTATAYQRGRLHQVRFSPGILMAPLRTPTLPPATTTNCYVVGHERLFVIDPGSPEPEEQQRLLALLDELECSGATVEGILITHDHPDHSGGINALSTARNLPVHGHPLTLERLAPGFVKGRTLEDGAAIQLGRAPDGTDGWHLSAIHTPGHDRGHLCFCESRYGTAIVGDMLSTVSTIIVDPPEGHLATYLESLERLAQEPLTTLYPAHGPARRDGQKLVRQYLRHRQKRESSLVRALQQGGCTIEGLLPKVYQDTPPALYPFAGRSLLAGLEKLAEEGRARQTNGRWTVGEP